MKRTATTLLTLLAAAAALAACGHKEPPLPPALSPAQATDEYRAEAAHLQLPPGQSWPVAPIMDKGPDGSGNVYEPGFGKQAADHDWFCFWAERVLDANLPANDHDAALTTMLSIKNTYYYLTALVPDSRPLLDDVLRSAQLGDLGPLQRDHELNCSAG